ncbi:nuclease-related domain-containing protein [Planococcus sp. CAU13]|uniref:nuclease-related domain-containing protein n=1 Tax=Planococcus sp. CAU13 TaxID=1541197 RepID=UPI0006910599|nr:nuclease-related domain-containing protein [Planococcus sp. CAU13]
MWECVRLLIERLPSGHTQQEYLKKEFHRYEAGWQGEKRLHAKMAEFHWPEPYEILWDIGLRLGDWKVQIDGLLVTPRCLIIISSKNISGKIHFDAVTTEFYRFNNEGEKMVMDDPLVQLAKHTRFLELWLKKRKVKHPPIDGVVVFTPRHCEFIAKPVNKHICKTYQVVEKIYEILESMEPAADSPKPSKIRKAIEANIYPYERPPLCEYYRIEPRDLMTGVKCVECRKIAVERLYKIWRCTVCGHRDPLAHKLTLQEYFNLISHEIDNKEFRRFSGVTSIYAASRMLTESNLTKTGANKNRKYQIQS